MRMVSNHMGYAKGGNLQQGQWWGSLGQGGKQGEQRCKTSSAQLQKSRASSQRQGVGGGKGKAEAHWHVPAVTQHQQDSWSVLTVGPGIGLISSAVQPSEQHYVLQLDTSSQLTEY